ncbi:MAG: hypothetical protein PVI00_08205 [Desulfobacterales bacterium]
MPAELIQSDISNSESPKTDLKKTESVNQNDIEKQDQRAQAVDGPQAPINTPAESERPDKDEHDTDPPQEVSKEVSVSPVNDQALSDANDDESGISAIDSQDTSRQEDSAHESEASTPAAAATKTSSAKMAVSALLISILCSGFFIFESKSKIKKDKTVAEAPSEDRPQPLQPENHQIVDISSTVTPSIYDDSIKEIRILRDTLLKKQAEVLMLKKRYRQRIEELEKEILDEQRRSGVQTYLQASNNTRIVFSLKTIQRRQAYIKQLQKPLKWVSEACEELLYLRRRVMTDLKVSAIASGIDMDKHAQQMHRALREYRPTADNLAIVSTDTRLESLETIWQQIQDKQYVVSAEPVYSKNQIISAQICAGNFNRIGELSEMTAATAKCIAEMQASDLFLNQITEISPGAAKQLSQWKGSWICMNGVRALSPRVAHYLFQWDGQLISLNGLTDFPAEIGEALLGWRGGQLELMGLLESADSRSRIGIEYLAEWERSGGKLFVPKNLRKKIDALHKSSG